ncbi:MAG: nucleotidyltransferase domain-containing protein [Ignisphaera sp.]
MSEKLLIKLASHRAEVYRNIRHYLKIIVETVKELDREAEVYLFGSIVEGTYTLSSDIDVLIVTDHHPENLLVKLWERGIKDPFEIHIIKRDILDLYRKRSKLMKIEDIIDSINTQHLGKSIQI